MKNLKLAMVALALVATAGCSTDSASKPAVPTMFKAEIDNLLASEPSELERAVLKDYAVSDAELSEARDAYSQCMDGFGLEADFGDGSGFAYGATPASQDSFAAGYDDRDTALDEMLKIADECTRGTIQTVGYLYYEMKLNPNGLTPAELVRECLESSETNPAADMTDEELLAAFSDEAFMSDSSVAACFASFAQGSAS